MVRSDFKKTRTEVPMAQGYTNHFENVRHALKQNNELYVREKHCDTIEPNTTLFLVAPQNGALTTVEDLNTFMDSLAPNVPWTVRQEFREVSGRIIFGNLMFAEASHAEDCNARRWTKVQPYPDATILEKAFRGSHEHQIDIRILQHLTWWKRPFFALSKSSVSLPR